MQIRFSPDLLKAKIKELGLTQTALSEKAGVHRKTVKRAMDGEAMREHPAGLIAKALEVDVADLTGEKVRKSDAERRENLRSVGLHELRVTLNADEHLNFQLVADRYGVTSKDIIAYAPLFFMLEAERSLKARREQVGEMNSIADCLDVMQVNDSAYRAVSNLTEAIAAEQDSIDKRDIHAAMVEKDMLIHEPVSPFRSHVGQQVGALNLTPEVDWRFSEEGGDRFALFGDLIDKITDHNRRAVFALTHRFTLIRLLPKALAYQEGEAEAQAEARAAWLAEKVPEDKWQAEEERVNALIEGYDLEEFLGADASSSEE